MLRGGMTDNNLVVRVLMKDSPRLIWGISANGNTLRLHRRVESSILSSSTIFVVCKPSGISMRVTPLRWRVT